MVAKLVRSLSAPFSRTPDEHRPSRLLIALEARALMEWASMPLTLPWLMRQVPRGDGHSVLVLPGLLANDSSTEHLRSFLTRKGYDVHGWRQGRNFGPRPGVRQTLDDQLAQLNDNSGRKVSVIGWSLGGLYAREVARAAPERVRQVITLGSPLYGNPATSSNAWDIYRVVSDNDADDRRGDGPPPVPTTSIYTRGDGVVGWGCCVEYASALTDNIEINSTSHTGLGVNPLVWYAIGDRLAQPEDGWSHFQPRGLHRLLYPFKAPQRRTPETP